MRAIFNLRNGITTLAIWNKSEEVGVGWQRRIRICSVTLAWMRDLLDEWLVASQPDIMRAYKLDYCLAMYAKYKIPSDYFGANGWLKTHRWIPWKIAFWIWNVVTLIKFMFVQLWYAANVMEKVAWRTEQIEKKIRFENLENFMTIFYY